MPMKRQSALVLATGVLLCAAATVWLLSGDDGPSQPFLKREVTPAEQEVGKLVAEAPTRTPIPDIPRAKQPPADASRLGTHLLDSSKGPAAVKDNVPYTGIRDPRAARIYEIYQMGANYIRKKYPDPKTRPADQRHHLAVKEAELTLMNEQRFYYFGESELAPNMTDLPPRTSERYFIMTSRGGLTIVFELDKHRFPAAFDFPPPIAKTTRKADAQKK